MDGALAPALDTIYAALQAGGLAAGRAMGLTLVCTIFAWANLTSGLLRMGFAVALGAPVLLALWGRGAPVLAGLEAPVLVLVAKEMLIGLLLSLPFEALVAAGGVLDAYRGSGAPGPSPTGDMTPYGQLLVVMGLWLFAGLGGFWAMADMLYGSYALWPVRALLPPLSSASLPALLGVLEATLRSAVILAGPGVIVMMACDLVFMISARLGKQLNVAYLSGAVKSLLLLVMAPLFAMALLRVVGPSVIPSPSVEAVWRALLR